MSLQNRNTLNQAICLELKNMCAIDSGVDCLYIGCTVRPYERIKGHLAGPCVRAITAYTSLGDGMVAVPCYRILAVDYRFENRNSVVAQYENQLIEYARAETHGRPNFVLNRGEATDYQDVKVAKFYYIVYFTKIKKDCLPEPTKSGGT